MKCVYQLIHSRITEVDSETGEEIYTRKILGFFETEEKCEEMIRFYIQQPGFKDYPNGFSIEKCEADLNDYNDVIGDYNQYVYYLLHEWYDGEFEYWTELGCYSNIKNAEQAERYYRNDLDFKEHPEGFRIEKYLINEMEWPEGFCTSEEMDDI